MSREASVEDRAADLLSRMSSILLLLIVATSTVYVILTGGVPAVAVASGVLLLLVQLLSWFGRPGLGKWLLVLGLVGFVFAMLPTQASPGLVLIWLVFPIIIAVVLLSSRGAAVVLALCLGATVLYSFLFVDNAWYEIAMSLLILSFTGAMALTAQRMREQDVAMLKSRAQDLAKRKQYWEALVMHSPVGIVTLDMKHTITSTNPAFDALFGYRGDQIIGRKLDDLLVPATEQGEASRLTGAVMSGGTVQTAALRRRSDGSLVDVEVAGVPIAMTGETVAALAIYQDISQRKNAERELVARQARLEVLNRVAFAVADMSGLPETMRMMVDYARWVTNAETAIIALPEPETGQIEALYFASGSQREAPSAAALAESCVLERVLNGETVQVDGLVLEAEPLAASSLWRDARACMGVPVKHGNHVMAAIWLTHTEPNRAFQAQDLEMIQTLSHLVAMALKTSHQFSELADAAAFQRKILATAATAVYTVDTNMTISTVNEAFTEITGYSEQQIIGKHCSILIGDPCTRHCGLYDSNRTAPISHRQCEITARTGRRLTIVKNADLIYGKHGQVVGGIESFIDVTDLTAARRDAEAANRAKSEFLANMSHELRTPLNAILGFAQLMQRSPTFPPEHRENLQIIGRSGEALLELINDILDMSKIEAGRITYDPAVFDLYSMLGGVLEMFAARARAKDIQLTLKREPGVPQFLETDERKLRQVLINLLSNAVKFTNTGSIMLSVKLQPPNSTGMPGTGAEPGSGTDVSCFLRFAVTDTGVGISTAELPVLFEAFTQTSSGKTLQEGTGLGLPISQQFVRIMGGEVTVESQPGQGSTFAFVLPVHEATDLGVHEKMVQRQVTALAPDQPEYRILVADDREENRLLLRQLLESVGFAVRTAANGQDAIAVHEDWCPHLIFMDMRMPVMDGYEATEHIKATLRGQTTVVIALTASALETDRAISISAGCDDYIRKPFRDSEIFAALAHHLGVCYECAEGDNGAGRDDAGMPETQLAAEHLAGLPAEWRAAMRDAATRARDDLARELIVQLDEDYAVVAATLLELIDNYQFDRLVAFLSESS